MIAVRLEPDIITAIEREADKEDRPLASMTWAPAGAATRPQSQRESDALGGAERAERLAVLGAKLVGYAAHPVPVFTPSASRS